MEDMIIWQVIICDRDSQSTGRKSHEGIGLIMAHRPPQISIPEENSQEDNSKQDKHRDEIIF